MKTKTAPRPLHVNPLGRLFWKFFFAFWIALVLAGVGASTAFWLLNRPAEGTSSELSENPRSALGISAASAILRHGGVAAMREMLEERRRRGILRLLVVDEQGRDLLGRPVAEAALRDARAAAVADPDGRAARSVVTRQGEVFLVFVPAGQSPGRGMLQRREPLSPMLLLAIGIVASLAVSMLLAWYVSKPIRNLRWAFAAAALGRLETRVAPLMGGRRDEIADLGRDFDRMAQRLQALLDAQKRLLHDISHELRSPLARLQAAIGLARQDPARVEASLERIEQEAVRLDQLVGEVLTLSRLESGASAESQECVDLVELIASVCEDARFEAEASGRSFTFSGSGEAMARVHAELLYRAVENVVRNAVKYAPEGSCIEVVLSREVPQRLVVRVLDRGPGVAPEDLERIFEPFYRGRADTVASGFGLGLAIARHAVQAHGGSIRATNRDGGGLLVEISLPLGG